MARPTLGARIRELRIERRLTLAQVGAIAGTSVSYLNDLEHDRRTPSLPKLQAVAASLGTSAYELLEGVDPYGFRPSADP